MGPAPRRRRTAVAAGHEGTGRTSRRPPGSLPAGDQARTRRDPGHRVRRTAAPAGARPPGRQRAGAVHFGRPGRSGGGRLRSPPGRRRPGWRVQVPAVCRAPIAALLGPASARPARRRRVTGPSGPSNGVPRRAHGNGPGPLRGRPGQSPKDGPLHPRAAFFPAAPGGLHEPPPASDRGSARL